jgi:hypothetical protein
MYWKISQNAQIPGIDLLREVVDTTHQSTMFQESRLTAFVRNPFFKEQHTNFTVFYHVDKYHRLTKKSWIINENFTEASTCFKPCTHPACLWFSNQTVKPTQKLFEAMYFNNPKATPALGSFVWAGRQGDLQIVPHVLTGTPLVSTGIAAHLTPQTRGGHLGLARCVRHSHTSGPRWDTNSLFRASCT